MVEREEGADHLVHRATRIETAPAYCTGVGKAVLALQDPQVITKVAKNEFKRYTNNTITTTPVLERGLARIRKQGYAIDNGEHEIWVPCIVAPIRNAGGRVFAGISVTRPAD